MLGLQNSSQDTKLTLIFSAFIGGGGEELKPWLRGLRGLSPTPLGDLGDLGDASVPWAWKQRDLRLSFQVGGGREIIFAS